MTLKLENLKEGDVLLLKDLSETTHKLIAVGQSLIWKDKGETSIVHAGLYGKGGRILEASGQSGLRSEALKKKTPGYRYLVYRLDANYNPQNSIGKAAAHWAENYITKRETDKFFKKKKPFGDYSKTKAFFRGLMGRSNRGKRAKKALIKLSDDKYVQKSHYCSGFVVQCYEVACEQKFKKHVIEADFRNISPKTLHDELEKSEKWTTLGEYQL